MNISDPGQGASNPQLAIDPSGNILAVWQRSDGTNLRIQAAYKPSAGAFATPVTVSDPGFDAFKPAVDVDSTGKAIVVWSRFDGTNIRVQGTTRTAGSGGTFANEVTLSAPGQDANDPVTARVPTRTSTASCPGTAQTARTCGSSPPADGTWLGTRRPSGAGPLRASLVPAYNACAAPNRTHGPSLVYPSCNPPTRPTTVLTVGTPDANGFSASSASSMRFKAVVGNPATEANEADVQTVINVNDVRCASPRTSVSERHRRRRLHRPGRDQGQPPDHGPAQCCRAAGARNRPELPARVVGSVHGDGRDHQGRRLQHDHQSERDPPGRGAGNQAHDLGNGPGDGTRRRRERHRLRRLPANLR